MSDLADRIKRKMLARKETPLDQVIVAANEPPLEHSRPEMPVEAQNRPAKASKPAKVAKDGRFAQTLEGVLPERPVKKAPPKKKTPPRLPDQSNFAVTYHAGRQEWHGVLTVYLERDGKPQKEMFASNARTVFTLLAKLDGFYRLWMKGKK